MDALRTLLPLAALFFVMDLPWLYTIGGWTQSMVKTIQGGAPFQMRWEGAPVVYLALAFLLTRARNTVEAFWIGLSTYAVYDFTNYATLAKYELNFAMADTLWGGTLFALVREAALRLNLL